MKRSAVNVRAIDRPHEHHQEQRQRHQKPGCSETSHARHKSAFDLRRRQFSGVVGIGSSSISPSQSMRTVGAEVKKAAVAAAVAAAAAGEEGGNGDGGTNAAWNSSWPSPGLRWDGQVGHRSTWNPQIKDLSLRNRPVGAAQKQQRGPAGLHAGLLLGQGLKMNLPSSSLSHLDNDTAPPRLGGGGAVSRNAQRGKMLVHQQRSVPQQGQSQQIQQALPAAAAAVGQHCTHDCANTNAQWDLHAAPRQHANDIQLWQQPKLIQEGPHNSEPQNLRAEDVHSQRDPPVPTMILVPSTDLNGSNNEDKSHSEMDPLLRPTAVAAPTQTKQLPHQHQNQTDRPRNQLSVSQSFSSTAAIALGADRLPPRKSPSSSQVNQQFRGSATPASSQASKYDSARRSESAGVGSARPTPPAVLDRTAGNDANIRDLLQCIRTGNVIMHRGRNRIVNDFERPSDAYAGARRVNRAGSMVDLSRCRRRGVAGQGRPGGRSALRHASAPALRSILLSSRYSAPSIESSGSARLPSRNSVAFHAPTIHHIARETLEKKEAVTVTFVDKNGMSFEKKAEMREKERWRARATPKEDHRISLDRLPRLPWIHAQVSRWDGPSRRRSRCSVRTLLCSLLLAAGVLSPTGSAGALGHAEGLIAVLRLIGVERKRGRTHLKRKEHRGLIGIVNSGRHARHRRRTTIKQIEGHCRIRAGTPPALVLVPRRKRGRRERRRALAASLLFCLFATVLTLWLKHAPERVGNAKNNNSKRMPEVDEETLERMPPAAGDSQGMVDFLQQMVDTPSDATSLGTCCHAIARHDSEMTNNRSRAENDPSGEPAVAAPVGSIQGAAVRMWGSTKSTPLEVAFFQSRAKEPEDLMTKAVVSDLIKSMAASRSTDEVASQMAELWLDARSLDRSTKKGKDVVTKEVRKALVDTSSQHSEGSPGYF